MVEAAGQRRKRPILVWVIFVFYLVASVQTIMAMFFIAAGGVDLTPEQQAYLAHFSVFDRVIGYVTAGTTLIGVTLLLQLRRKAVPVLGLAFALNVFSTAVVTLKADPTKVVSPTGLAAQAAGMIVFGLVVLYAWRLQRKEVLQ